MITIGFLSFLTFKNVTLFDFVNESCEKAKTNKHQSSCSSIRFLLRMPVFEKWVTNMCNRRSRQDLMSRVDTSCESMFWHGFLCCQSAGCPPSCRLGLRRPLPSSPRHPPAHLFSIPSSALQYKHRSSHHTARLSLVSSQL